MTSKTLASKLNSRVKTVLLTVYALLVLIFSATSKAEPYVMPAFSGQGVSTDFFVGELVQDINSKFYLIIDEHSYFELSSNQDLSQYNGEYVRVDGFLLKNEFNHKAGPVYETYSFDPLSGEGKENAASLVMVVINISEVAEL